jgi:hypothetical protein
MLPGALTVAVRNARGDDSHRSPVPGHTIVVCGCAARTRSGAPARQLAGRHRAEVLDREVAPVRPHGRHQVGGVQAPAVGYPGRREARRPTGPNPDGSSGKVHKLAEICAAVVLAGETSLTGTVLHGDWVTRHDSLGRNRP